MATTRPEQVPMHRWTPGETITFLVMRGAGATYAAISAAMGLPNYCVRDKLAGLHDGLAELLAIAIVHPDTEGDLLLGAVIAEAMHRQNKPRIRRPNRVKPRAAIRSPGELDRLSEACQLQDARDALAARAAAATALGKKHLARIARFTPPGEG